MNAKRAVMGKGATPGHTEGPWEVRPSSNRGNGTEWRDIVSMGGEFKPSYVGEALEQDARLIAAAPELYAVLDDISQVMPSDDGSVTLSAENMVEIKELLSKATGKGV